MRPRPMDNKCIFGGANFITIFTLIPRGLHVLRLEMVFHPLFCWCSVFTIDTRQEVRALDFHKDILGTDSYKCTSSWSLFTTFISALTHVLCACVLSKHFQYDMVQHKYHNCIPGSQHEMLQYVQICLFSLLILDHSKDIAIGRHHFSAFVIE